MMNSPFLLGLMLTSLFIAGITNTALADTSALWGTTGEKWSPESRLPDFSFAGYHSGEAPIPTPPVKGNVRDFGAKGDGVTDDTAAFVHALETVNDGAILIPAGRYKINEILYIRKPNIVLRGEGTDKTTLFFPRALEQIKPNTGATTGGRPTSNYSWSGGLIWVEGQPTGAELGPIKSHADRGTFVIEMETAPAVKVGQKVEILQQDAADKSLIHHLYAGQTGDISKVSIAHTSFVSRVVSIDGTRVRLERPLRTDIDPRWKAHVRIFQPSVTEVGIENLTFEFPNTPYEGHFTEPGYNPFTFLNAADCWARNLRILNPDSGPFLKGNFITVENIVYESNRKPDNTGCQGHHGFTFGNDTLFQNFDFRFRFIHDISAEDGASGSVAAHGKGVDICFDNHKRFPYSNLYTDIDIGKGTRMYSSGGGDALGLHAGAWTTFWNIRAGRPQKWPNSDYGPDKMNLVGLESKEPALLDKEKRWFEPIPPAQLQPQNLYEAQRDRRLKKSASGTAHTVVVFGDSITAGSQLPDGEKPRLWVRQVEEKSNGQMQLVNCGKGGRPTASISEFEKMLTEQPRIDLLVLALGANDARDITDGCVPKAVQNLDTMITLARKKHGPSLPIVLVGPTNIRKEALGPTRPIADQREAKVRELNAAFAELAKKRQLPFISLNGVVPSASLSRDGVHPDAAGNDAITRTLLPVLLKTCGGNK
jgi:lysophospholipase L1-like esterase/ribosomal protein L21E